MPEKRTRAWQAKIVGTEGGFTLSQTPSLVIVQKDSNQFTGEKGKLFMLEPNGFGQYVVSKDCEFYAEAVERMEKRFAPKLGLQEIDEDQIGKLSSDLLPPKPAELKAENDALKKQLEALKAELSKLRK